MKPTKIKHFSNGPKYSNSLLTRFRVGKTELNLHKFSTGQTDNVECMCHAIETPIHYMLDCFLYTVERRILFDLVEHYIPKFKNMTKNAKFDLLINGINGHDPIYYYTNTQITYAVQMYIMKTKRFLQ